MWPCTFFCWQRSILSKQHLDSGKRPEKKEISISIHWVLKVWQFFPIKESRVKILAFAIDTPLVRLHLSPIAAPFIASIGDAARRFGPVGHLAWFAAEIRRRRWLQWEIYAFSFECIELECWTDWERKEGGGIHIERAERKILQWSPLVRSTGPGIKVCIFC